MAYKDKAKQKEANRLAQARFKAKSKGITSGQGITKGITSTKRGKDIKCFEDLPPDVQETINMMSRRDGKIDPIVKANRTAIAVNYQHLFPESYEPGPMEITRAEAIVMTASERANYKPASELGKGEFNHVSKPGDADYDGICTPEWIKERKAGASA